ncbi:glutamate racemase [Alicyclobacillus cycloheptanicus]|uniref:Glutamate racemase n=1 Tax=Alicyclobacillus cycloheptanicus TaxID=1457 RepID=A0ABT9XDB2_9BACL|nr:glutamate racemase [Alicyclobacillus cycloheptanicus]MDQ0188278.1 glutamate racemase [Alicyclobacillus cycloheptanicus]WDM00997.1 glutamate racemase [Alicyclobacillus cycloheptanicus]
MQNSQGDDRPIGVFDSGVGGLTVVSAIRDLLPDEEIYYFGDTARCPYGDREPEEVRTFSREVLDYLYDLDVKMFVVACNTATATALPLLKQRYDIPVLGVIEPGARAAVLATRTERIGVIGTAVTIASGAYETAIHAIAPQAKVFSAACPRFVPLVERGVVAGAAVQAIIEDSLHDLLGQDIDTLILGCTHYPLLSDAIARVVGPSVRLISSAHETARQVQRELNQLGALRNAERGPVHHRFFTSGDGSRMRHALHQWLNESPKTVDVTSVQQPLSVLVKGGRMV